MCTGPANVITVAAIDCTLDVVGSKLDGESVNQHANFVYSPAVPVVSNCHTVAEEIKLSLGFHILKQLELNPVQFKCY